MIRIAKFKRTNGYWYVRYWSGGRRVDEAARTKSESVAETCRIRREMEINAGIQPVKHGDVGELINRYFAALPPKTSDSHRHEASRILNGFVESF